MLKRLKFMLRVPKQVMIAWIRHQSVQFHNPDAYLSFPISLIYEDVHKISIGSGTTIDAFSEIVVKSPAEFTHVPARLTIGRQVIIGASANIRAAGGSISIGDNTLIAQQVSLIASGHLISVGLKPYRDLPWDTSKTGVVIGENVWVGANTTILPGCHVGNNSVIGAGSVVTKDIPANEIWVGVPAKKLKNVDSDVSDKAVII